MPSSRQILDYAQRLGRAFDPYKVILFGSRAYGKPTRDSDVDLLVIMPFRGHALDAALRVLKAVPPPFSLDLIVRQPSEVARRYREFDPLTRDAIDRGKVLYERNPEGMARQGGRRLSGGRDAHARPQTPKLRRRLLPRAAVN